MRGILFDLYNYTYAAFSDLGRLGSGNLIVANTNGFSTVLNGTWESPNEVCVRCV